MQYSPREASCFQARSNIVCNPICYKMFPELISIPPAQLQDISIPKLCVTTITIHIEKLWWCEHTETDSCIIYFCWRASIPRPTQICKRQTRGMQNLSDAVTLTEEEESGKRRICIYSSLLYIYFYLFSRPRPFISQRSSVRVQLPSADFQSLFFSHRSLWVLG
jgi:hypothetical protein